MTHTASAANLVFLPGLPSRRRGPARDAEAPRECAQRPQGLLRQGLRPPRKAAALAPTTFG